MNTLDVHADGAFCAYWTDGVGDKFTGSKYTIQIAFTVFRCRSQGYMLTCLLRVQAYWQFGPLYLTWHAPGTFGAYLPSFSARNLERYLLTSLMCSRIFAIIIVGDL